MNNRCKPHTFVKGLTLVFPSVCRDILHAISKLLAVVLFAALVCGGVVFVLGSIVRTARALLYSQSLTTDTLGYICLVIGTLGILTLTIFAIFWSSKIALNFYKYARGQETENDIAIYIVSYILITMFSSLITLSFFEKKYSWPVSQNTLGFVVGLAFLPVLVITISRICKGAVYGVKYICRTGAAAESE